METQHLIAGTPEWHAHRATHFNASDAPAMLGCSPYTTRAQLLHKLHTGLAAEHDAATERRFADGHRFEALARPLAEELIGDDLAPVVGTLGELSASFDGLTMMGDTAFEHKTLNSELRECMEGEDEAPRLPKHYRAQMEQQLLVSGAERVLFMASKWDGDTLVEERHCWYASDPVLRAEIVAGWKQFAKDLATYTPPATVAAVVAAPVQALPAVSVIVTGEITIKDNFAAFETAVRDFLEHRLIREPKSDQDFADLDVQIKAMKGAEAALESAEAQMLAQIQTVDSAKKTKDMLAKLVRENRLTAEKLLASRKEQIKGEIVQKARAAYEQHIAALTADTGGPWIVLTPPDFAGKIKNLRTLASLQDAVDTELARCKIVADESARKIRAALAALADESKGFEHLFADRLSFIGKSAEDVRLLARARIAEHKAAEEKKEADTRERIRAEEQAKAEKEAREKIAAEQAEARRSEQNAAATDAMTNIAAARQADALPGPVLDALEDAATSLIADLTIGRAANPPNVVPMGTRAPKAPATPPTLKLGQIGERLGFSLTADFLKQLGFEPAAKEKSALLFHEGQFDVICEALHAHIRTVQAKQKQAA